MQDIYFKDFMCEWDLYYKLLLIKLLANIPFFIYKELQLQTRRDWEQIKQQNRKGGIRKKTYSSARVTSVKVSLAVLYFSCRKFDAYFLIWFRNKVPIAANEILNNCNHEP